MFGGLKVKPKEKKSTNSLGHIHFVHRKARAFYRLSPSEAMLAWSFATLSTVRGGKASCHWDRAGSSPFFPQYKARAVLEVESDRVPKTPYIYI